MFQALLGYVVILARIGCGRDIRQSKVEQERGYKREKRDVMLEWILFSWVFGSAFIFNVFYWSLERSAL